MGVGLPTGRANLPSKRAEHPVRDTRRFKHQSPAESPARSEWRKLSFEGPRLAGFAMDQQVAAGVAPVRGGVAVHEDQPGLPRHRNLHLGEGELCAGGDGPVHGIGGASRDFRSREMALYQRSQFFG